MTANVEVIVGTYEEFLVGYRLDTQNEHPVLVQSFADKAHAGSLKSLAVSGPWIASGATDDRIILYDMRTRKQSQILQTHDGTVNALAFTPDETHLLSGGDDGHIVCTRLKSWTTEANWKNAHNGLPVTHIGCHPSGKLALSLGGDLVLHTWNLVKGRVAFLTNLKSRGTLGCLPDCLSWSPDGDYFTLAGQRVVEFWSIKVADVALSVKTASKPVSVCWIAAKTCLVGFEDGKILWTTLETDTEKEILLVAHTSRVKAMCFHNGSLVTVSSAGELKLWAVDRARKKLKEVAVVNIGCRPTCLGLLDLTQFGDNYSLIHKISATIGSEKAPQKKAVSQSTQPKANRSRVVIEYENNDKQATKVADEVQNDADVLSNDKVDESSSEVTEATDDSADIDDDDDDDDDESEEDTPPQFMVATNKRRKRPPTKATKPMPQPAKVAKLTSKKQPQNKSSVKNAAAAMAKSKPMPKKK